MINDKKYYRINLTNDVDFKLHLILDFVLQRTEYLDFCLGFCKHVKYDEFEKECAKSPITSCVVSEDENIILVSKKYLDFELKFQRSKSENPLFYNYFKEIYLTKKMWMKEYEEAFCMARYSLSQNIKAYLKSLKTIEDWWFNDPALLDPIFYQNDIAICWTVSSEGYFFLLLNESELQDFNRKNIFFTETVEIDEITKSKISFS